MSRPIMKPAPSPIRPQPSRPSSSKPPSGSSSPPLAPKPIGIDIDGDGKPDIFVNPKPGLGIDIDGDGKPDIVFPKKPENHPPSLPEPSGNNGTSGGLELGPDGLPVIPLPPRKDH